MQGVVRRAILGGAAVLVAFVTGAVVPGSLRAEASAQAAQTAGLSQADFLRELGQRRIPIHYGREELEADLEAVEALTGR